MNKIDSLLPEIGLIHTTILVIILGVIFQAAGSWVLMLVVGFIGSLMVRTSRKAFIAGFLGIATAWTILFVYLINTSQALEIANVFIGLLGLSGLGWLVIVISILIGGFLGGFGGLLGRSLIETVDDFMGDTSMIDKIDSSEDQE